MIDSLDCSTLKIIHVHVDVKPCCHVYVHVLYNKYACTCIYSTKAILFKGADAQLILEDLCAR